MSDSNGCCFVVEARLARNGSAYWDPRQSFPKDHWEESLHVFGRITVLARTQSTEESPTGAVVFPPGVSLGEFPYYVGPLNAAAKSLALLFVSRHWARQGKTFILRIPGFVPSLVWLWLRHYRKPYAVEVLGDPNQVFEVVHHPLRRLWKHLYSRAQAAMIRQANAAMYVSKTLVQLYPPRRHCPAAVISDVRLTDAAFTRPRTYSSPPKPLRLAHVGTMEQPYKGHDYLLNAIAICRRNGFPVEATLVGDGRLRSTLERKSGQLGLEKVIHFRGLVPWGPALFEVLDSADLFVMCSLTEGLPKALIEAMARGLVAVGSNVGGIPELLSSDVLVPAADEQKLAEKILELGTNPQELTRLSVRNFEEASLYRHDKLSRMRLEFYREFKATVDRQ